MAIAFDADLGFTQDNDAGGTTISLTTTAAAAAGSRVIVGVSWWAATAVTLSSVTIGGVTAAIDIVYAPASTGDHVALASLTVPSGLASSSTITATYASSTSSHAIMAASFTGCNAVAQTGQNSSGAGSWAAPSLTTAAESVVFAVAKGDATSTNTPTSPSVEVHDFNSVTANRSWATEYRIETAAGSYVVAGAWGAGVGSFNAVAAYPAPTLPGLRPFNPVPFQARGRNL